MSLPGKKQIRPILSGKKQDCKAKNVRCQPSRRLKKAAGLIEKETLAM
jgi:hypothetical protein